MPARTLLILLALGALGALAACGAGDAGSQLTSTAAIAGCYRGEGVRAGSGPAQGATAVAATLVLDSVVEPGGRSYHARVVTGARAVTGSWHRGGGGILVGILGSYPPAVYRLHATTGGLAGTARLIPLAPGTKVDSSTWTVTLTPTACGPVLAPLQAFAGPRTPLPPDVRTELARMGGADQAARRGMSPASVADTTLANRLARGDSSRSKRLEEIIQRWGWPTPSRAGETAAGGAFLVLQHSPSAELQARMAPRLDTLARAGEASGQEVALLTDRVLKAEGQPQRYGTQFDIKDGQLVLYPIADPAGVDARRAELGLMPLATYRQMLERMYVAPARQ